MGDEHSFLLAPTQFTALHNFLRDLLLCPLMCSISIEFILGLSLCLYLIGPLSNLILYLLQH
jgi:hypothetical protein